MDDTGCMGDFGGIPDCGTGGYGFVPGFYPAFGFYPAPFGASLYGTGYMLGQRLMGFGTGESLRLFAMAGQERRPDARQNPVVSGKSFRIIWKCCCGSMNGGKFCSECGTPRSRVVWQCSCGEINQGHFCTECGNPKPEESPKVPDSEQSS
jgi:hypothetical protein